MNILGISAYYHDSACALIKDGKVVVAIEEERFTRVKHDNRFPIKALNHCLESQGLSINDIDYISYYEKPLLRFERIIDNFVLTFPFGIKQFLETMPEWLGTKIKVEYLIK